MEQQRTWLDYMRGLALRTDIFLLLFLLLFAIDSVVIKPIALAAAILYLLPQRFRLKYRDAPLFYLLIPAMEIVRLLAFDRDFSAGRLATVIIGISYWLMAWVAFLIVRHRAETGGKEKIAGTLTAWFFINAAYSFWQLAMTMVHSGSINPYGVDNLTYGSSTGDFIKGVMLAPCYLNMFVNSFFAVWFIYRRKWGLAVLASLICSLTTTNFANILFVPALLLLLFVFREKKARLTVLASAGIFVLFNLLVSTGNLTYMQQSVDNSAGRVVTGRGIYADTANKTEREDSIIRTRQRIAIIFERLARPNGKVLSWTQTWDYVTSSPVRFFAGAGVGNFSSLVALQMAHIYGRKHSRFYEHMPHYVHPAYRANHFRIMNDVYALPEGYHSARHMPHSFPNQLMGEYGLIGVFLFLAGYVWYFIRRGGGRGYFLVIMLLTAGYLWFDYLFEYLSVMLFFELFFWMHKAEEGKSPEHG